MTLVKYILFIFVTVSYFFSSSNSLAQDLEKHWHNGDRFQNLPGAPERDISFRTYFDFTIQRTLSFPEISEIVVDGIKITALPARHWSRRGLFDENHSLWMSAIIENSTRRIYFSGDTGYAPYFEQLGQKYGPFDIALINSGAYEPREMMRFSHTTPEEAINLGFDMRAKVLVPMAWGTVQLGTEPPFEAPQRFRAQALKRGLKPDDVWVFSIGETRILK